MTKWADENWHPGLSEEEMAKLLPDLAEILKKVLRVPEVEVVIGVPYDEIAILMISGRAA